MPDDPFVIVKLQVEEALVNADVLFTSWQRIQRTVQSSENQELVWAADELRLALEGIAMDLGDLEAAFKALQANPVKFGVSTKELQSRRTFLNQAQKTVATMQQTIETNVTGGKVPQDKPSPVGRDLNERWIQDERQQQMVMMQEQETHLDGLSGTLVQLRDIAGTMHREMDDQAILLNDLGDQVDRSQGRLSRAMKNITNLLKREEESKSDYCVCCLIIVLIVLLVLVVLI
ncbi:t-SNARE [Spinellus fusiger]|nr:t-SNARE [Spinellus fusiger]